MRKLTALALGCLFAASVALADSPSEADQKWLTVVEKKIAAGETNVSTPSEERVNLLKKWAAKKSYSVEVTKSDTSFRVQVSKQFAQN